jgi:hypothetical protein
MAFVELVQEYLRAEDIDSANFSYPKTPGKLFYKIKYREELPNGKTHKYYSYDDIHKVFKNADKALGRWWRAKAYRKDTAKRIKQHFESNCIRLDFKSDTNRALISRLAAEDRTVMRHLIDSNHVHLYRAEMTEEEAEVTAAILE